jgi:hypothetical protein
MDPNPPSPPFQLALLLLISIEVVAVVLGNDILLVIILALIAIVAFFWIRHNQSRTPKAEYSPRNATSKEDWKGKTDKDNNPL